VDARTTGPVTREGYATASSSMGEELIWRSRSPHTTIVPRLISAMLNARRGYFTEDEKKKKEKKQIKTTKKGWENGNPGVTKGVGVENASSGSMEIHRGKGAKKQHERSAGIRDLLLWKMLFLKKR